jgi:hypothetical protein
MPPVISTILETWNSEVQTNIIFFWDDAPCSIVEIGRHFSGTTPALSGWRHIVLQELSLK